MNPKRRRWLAVVIVVVLALVMLGVLVSREDTQEDSPRLVFVGQEQRAGQKVMVFRFEAPIHGKAFLKYMSTENVLTGVRSRPILVAVEPQPKVLVGADVGLPAYPVGNYDSHGIQFPPRHPFDLKRGASPEYHIQPPNDPVWRLRCETIVAGRAFTDGKMDDWLRRIRRSWRYRSLSYLRNETMGITMETVESDPITNAVSSTTESSAK